MDFELQVFEEIDLAQLTRLMRTTGWRLQTPIWAVCNHHFYENCCGFVRTKVNKGGGGDPDQVIFCKGAAVKP